MAALQGYVALWAPRLSAGPSTLGANAVRAQLPASCAERRQPLSSPAGRWQPAVEGFEAAAAALSLAALAVQGRNRWSPRRAAILAGRGRHNSRVLRTRGLLLRAEGESDAESEAEAEARLAALQAELEALEDELDTETQERQAALEGKVETILQKAPPGPSSGVSTSVASPPVAQMGKVAVCGIGSEGVQELLLGRLTDAASLGVAEPLQVDLEEVGRLNFDKVAEMLEGCNTAVVCPDAADDRPETLEKVLQGIKGLLAGAPNELTRILLLSHVGAQQSKGGFNLGSFFGESSSTTWDNLEDELTKAARLRTSSRPLRTIIVRVGAPPASSKTAPRVVCLPADEGVDSFTSTQTAAEALFQTLALSVDTGFSVVEEPVTGETPEPPTWSELLLPFIGPEVLRISVDDAKRAAFFVQGWAEEFFGEGKRASRMGVKTPVELRKTAGGVILKFRPLGTEDELNFDDLRQGGVEFVAEESPSGEQRLRAFRCSYGWKVSVKENSERALLDKFAKDWEEVV